MAPPGGFGARRTAGFWTGDGEAMAAGFLHRTDGPAGVGFAAGGVLDRLEPGPVLASFLADALEGGVPGGAVLGGPDDPEDGSGDGDADSVSSRPGVIGQRGGGQGAAALGESELIGALCGARRMASLAAAQELEVIITLARRRTAQAREHKNPHLAEHITDEIAAALTLTRRAATRLLDIAGGLARLAAVRSALALGIIDWPRAVVFADELTALGDADARAAADKVLPDAGEMTTGQLRNALRRAVLLIDPDAARRRRQKARKDASVQLWDEPSGNYALAGRELPHAQVIAADARLTAKAKWLQARGAAGTLDQLRAAVFTAVLADQPLESLLPDPAASSARTDAAGSPASANPQSGHPSGSSGDPANQGPMWPSLTGTVNLTMPLAAWAGVSEAPGEVGGHGPLDAEACRDLAAWLAANRGTRWCVTLTDAAGRAVAHACARHGPGPASSAPDGPAGSSGPPGNGGPPHPTGPPHNSGPPGTTGPPSHASHHGTVGQQGPRAGPLIQWLRTLRPTRLDTGECAHRDEVSGYRPSRRLRHLIEVRQRTCTAPGCRARPSAATSTTPSPTTKADVPALATWDLRAGRITRQNSCPAGTLTSPSRVSWSGPCPADAATSPGPPRTRSDTRPLTYGSNIDRLATIQQDPGLAGAAMRT